MFKKCLVIISSLLLQSCMSYYGEPVDIYGNPSEDIFKTSNEEDYSIEEKGSITVVNNNTLKACNYGTLEAARHNAYLTALDIQSKQNISAKTQTTCVEGSLNSGCMNELDVSSVMNDTKFVNTTKRDNCYIFTFKKVSSFTKTQSSDQISYYDYSHSSKGESLFRLNINNSTTLVKTKINGKVYWVNGKEDLEFFGPVALTVEIVDDRFTYKKFIINVPKQPKIITKNISLSVINKNNKKYKQFVGKGFERQDYIRTDLFDKSVSSRFIRLKNRGTEKITSTKNISGKYILSGAEIGIEVTHYDIANHSQYILISIPESIKFDYYWNYFAETQGGLSSVKEKCTNSKLNVTVQGEEFKKLVKFTIPFTSCMDGKYHYHKNFYNVSPAYADNYYTVMSNKVEYFMINKVSADKNAYTYPNSLVTLGELKVDATLVGAKVTTVEVSIN